MTKQQTSIGRRYFLKTSVLDGGGLMLSFSWLDSFAFNGKEIIKLARCLIEKKVYYLIFVVFCLERLNANHFIVLTLSCLKILVQLNTNRRFSRPGRK
jgi:hypothetical protein